MCQVRDTFQVGFTFSVGGKNAQAIQNGADESCQISTIGSLRQVTLCLRQPKPFHQFSLSAIATIDKSLLYVCCPNASLPKSLKLCC